MASSPGLKLVYLLLLFDILLINQGNPTKLYENIFVCILLLSFSCPWLAHIFARPQTKQRYRILGLYLVKVLLLYKETWNVPLLVPRYTSSNHEVHSGCKSIYSSYFPHIILYKYYADFRLDDHLLGSHFCHLVLRRKRRRFRWNREE